MIIEAIYATRDFVRNAGVGTHLFGIVAAIMEVCLGLILEPTDQRKMSNGQLFTTMARPTAWDEGMTVAKAERTIWDKRILGERVVTFKQ